MTLPSFLRASINFHRRGILRSQLNDKRLSVAYGNHSLSCLDASHFFPPRMNSCELAWQVTSTPGRGFGTQRCMVIAALHKSCSPSKLCWDKTMISSVNKLFLTNLQICALRVCLCISLLMSQTDILLLISPFKKLNVSILIHSFAIHLPYLTFGVTKRQHNYKNVSRNFGTLKYYETVCDILNHYNIKSQLDLLASDVECLVWISFNDFYFPELYLCGI